MQKTDPRSFPAAAARFAATVSEARRIAQPRAYSPSITDAPYRAVSIFPSLVLARLRIAPNFITVTWGVMGLAGVVALAWQDYVVRVAGAVLLETSYLLDFVDGEVARLLARTSKRGFFIDLACHGLIKSSLFLALGYGLYRQSGRPWVLILAFLAAVALSSGYGLPFWAQAAQVRTPEPQRPRSNSLGKLLGLPGYLFESPGLYGVVLLGALFDRLSWVVLLYGVCAPVWLLHKAVQYRAE